MTKGEMRYKLNEVRMMLNDGEHGEEQGMLVEIIKELDKEEWIPVSKRLPEAGHVVYCQLIDGSHEILFLEVYSDGQMNWVGKRMRDYKVEAWRELPENYKAESEDE